MSPARAPARVFVGLPLGPELAGDLTLALQEAPLGGDFRRTRPESFHLTLAFLGDVPRARLGALAEALAAALGGCPAPRLRLSGTGGFPQPGRARVLWVGLREGQGPGRLAACRRATLEALARAGLRARDEERFQPHVTVARARAGGHALPPDFAALAFELPWDPREALLFETHLLPEGSRHESLASFPFGASD